MPLLKGPADDQGGQLYASHTIWEDEAAFHAWTESEAFRKAHAQGGRDDQFVHRAPQRLLTGSGREVDGLLLQSSRLAALPNDAHRFAATNPVFLLWGERP